MHTYMDHLRLREEEREGKEAGESEEGKEREGEGESDLEHSRPTGPPSHGRQFCGRFSIGCLNDTAFCHYLCSGAWLKILCAMLLEQEGQEP